MAENRTIEKKPRGKESEKKYFDKFIAMIVFSLFIGGMIGFFSMGIRDWLLRNVRIGKEVEALCDFSGWIVLGIYAAEILILSIITLCHYAKARKMSGKWDGENEAVIDVIEKSWILRCYATAFF